MRLTPKQMRCIRALRMKRSEWVGKDLTIIHEYLGKVVFGRGSK